MKLIDHLPPKRLEVSCLVDVVFLDQEVSGLIDVGGFWPCQRGWGFLALYLLSLLFSMLKLLFRVLDETKEKKVGTAG